MQSSSTNAAPVVVDMEALLRQLHELAGRAGQAPPQEETATAAGENDRCAA